MDKYQTISAVVQGALGFCRLPEVVEYNSFLESHREVRDGVECIVFGDGDKEKFIELCDAYNEALLKHSGIN